MQKLYWLTFPNLIATEMPIGTAGGIGVTADSREDALRLVVEALFKIEPLPNDYEISEISDFHSLDQNHVVPNMGNHFQRGVWFPNITK